MNAESHIAKQLAKQLKTNLNQTTVHNTNNQWGEHRSIHIEHGTRHVVIIVSSDRISVWTIATTRTKSDSEGTVYPLDRPDLFEHIIKLTKHHLTKRLPRLRNQPKNNYPINPTPRNQ